MHTSVARPSPQVPIIPGPVIVFVILEQDSVGATFARHGDGWTAPALTDADIPRMPEIGIELSLSEIYVNADLGDATSEPAS
jgi:hypothetical protein